MTNGYSYGGLEAVQAKEEGQANVPDLSEENSTSTRSINHSPNWRFFDAFKMQIYNALYIAEGITIKKQYHYH